MPLSDDSIEKWVYKEHTRVKHEILVKYLDCWIRILGKEHNLNIFDCFAGRGEYVNQERRTVEGSPVIIIRKLSEIREKMRRPKEATCVFIEKNEKNYRILREVVDSEIQDSPEKYQGWLEVSYHNAEFSDVATTILSNCEKTLAPSFFFLDPFGFGGIPFEIVKRILSIKKVEVFINFMVRDVNRFLESNLHRHSIGELYGIHDVAREISDHYSDLSKELALLKLYRNRLHQGAGVKYTFPFKVNADEKLQTTYYLIHCTNHPLGCKLMKEVMYKSGTTGRFGYLGPAEGQMDLAYYGGEERLGEYLLRRFSGKSISFRNVLYETLMETDFVEANYRRILKELDGKGRVSIEGRGKRGGLPEEATIHFPE